MKEIKNLKEIQKIELNILLYLDKICKENNLKYYLISGTLLGAIKYQGFIPWDDDIDVVLMRDDYLKLVKILANNTSQYKLLSIYNNKKYYYPFAKLVDSKTKLVENAKEIPDLGVFVDIFPLDAYKNNDNIEIQDRKLRMIRNLAVRRFRIKNDIRGNFSYNIKSQKVKLYWLKNSIYILIDYLSLPLGYNYWVNLLDKKLTKININDADYVGIRVKEFGSKETYLKQEILEQQKVKFEGYYFPSFKNYYTYLIKKYGDYRLDPPINKQYSHHQNKIYYRNDDT